MSSARLPREPDFYLRPLHFPMARANGVRLVASADTRQENRQWLEAHYGRVRIVPVPAKIILAAIERAFRHLLAERALRELAEHEPQFSAAQVVTRGQGIVFASVALALGMFLLVAPRMAGLFLVVLSGVAFCANAIFRAALLWVGADERPIAQALPTIADNDLPVYSILVPLYREANVLPALVQALRALDYPGLLAHLPQS